MAKVPKNAGAEQTFICYLLFAICYLLLRTSLRRVLTAL